MPRERFVLLGSGLWALGVALLIKKLSPVLSRLATIASVELRGVEAPKDKSAVRIGILGAANIAPPALIWPAHRMENVVVAAVAARDMKKAKKFAAKYRIPTVHATYQDLVEDPTLDAIYIPLPNGYHAHWTMQALRHGKHVLCEKPLASNEEEAHVIHQEAKKRRLLLVEAFHYRFHPMMDRLHLLIQKYIPEIQHVKAEFHIPFYSFSKRDIRYNNRGQFSELAGGALMDAGCYAVNFARHIVGKEPIEVQEVSMVEVFPGVDGHTKATLGFASNNRNSCTATIVASFQAWMPKISAEILGCNGRRIIVTNFLAPFVYHRIDIYDEESHLLVSEKVYNDDKTPWTSTYEFQLDAFVKATQGDPLALKRIQKAGNSLEGVQNMRTIDMIYRAAGLDLRRGLPISR